MRGHFGGIGNAMVSLFQITTLDGWGEIFKVMGSPYRSNTFPPTAFVGYARATGTRAIRRRLRSALLIEPAYPEHSMLNRSRPRRPGVPRPCMPVPALAARARDETEKEMSCRSSGKCASTVAAPAPCRCMRRWRRSLARACWCASCSIGMSLHSPSHFAASAASARTSTYYGRGVPRDVADDYDLTSNAQECRHGS